MKVIKRLFVILVLISCPNNIIPMQDDYASTKCKASKSLENELSKYEREFKPAIQSARPPQPSSSTVTFQPQAVLRPEQKQQASPVSFNVSIHSSSPSSLSSSLDDYARNIYIQESSYQGIRNAIRQYPVLREQFNRQRAKQMKALSFFTNFRAYQEQLAIDSLEFKIDGLDSATLNCLNYHWHKTVRKLQNILYHSDGGFLGINDTDIQDEAAWVIAQYIKQSDPALYMAIIKDLAQKGKPGFRNVLHLETNASFGEETWKSRREGYLDAQDISHKINRHGFNKLLRDLIKYCQEGNFNLAQSQINVYKEVDEGFLGGWRHEERIGIMHNAFQKYKSEYQLLQRSIAARQPINKIPKLLDKNNKIVSKRALPSQEISKGLPELLEIEETLTKIHQQRLQARKAALDRIKSGNNEISNKEFIISGQSVKILQEHDIDPDTFARCLGNEFQVVLHGEFVDIINQIAEYDAHYVSDNITSTIINFSDVGREYNQAGFIEKASSIADFCWSTLEVYSIAITRGAAKGAIKGVMQTGEMILHPIDTTTSIAKGVTNAACCLAKVLVDVTNLNDLAVLYPEKAETQVREYVDKIEAISQALGQKYQKMSGPERVEAAVEFAAEMYCSYKSLTTLGKFFNGAKTKAVALAKKVEQGTAKTAEVLSTAEGLEIKIAAESADMAELIAKHGEDKVSKVVQFAQQDSEFIKSSNDAAKATKKVKEFTDHLGNPQCKTLTTGEKCRLVRPNDAEKAWFEWAPKKYDEIRKWTDDVKKIAKNTGWPESKIQRIKNHMFYDKHELDRGIMRFDPSPDQAAAWDRLYKGDFIKNDIQLLGHEYFESGYERTFKVNSRTAHDATQRPKGRPWFVPEYQE